MSVIAARTMNDTGRATSSPQRFLDAIRRDNWPLARLTLWEMLREGVRSIVLDHCAIFRGAASLLKARAVARIVSTQRPLLLSIRSGGGTTTDHSTAKTLAAPSEISKTSNGATLTPIMPGEPSGIPGSEIPLMRGRSASSFLIALAGTWPSTT